jgi:MFS family permease
LLKGFITKTIFLVSLVSLFTDIASEMLYPVMPVYLKSIGFSVLFIGILEGIAEATAGLSKGYFGNLSDKSGKRIPFIRTGYTLSAFSKPLLALFIYPVWVFMARTMDRLGKGIRTSARDALLSDESAKENKGKVFGFHRGMDTLGAAIGPSIALVFLFYHPEKYRLLFYIAFLPGLFAILLTFFLKDKKQSEKSDKSYKSISFFSFLSYWKRANPAYKYLVIGLLAFTLMNSSDIFLLLAVKNRGFSDTSMIGLYIFYNLVYAVFSFPLGMLGDRIGLKNVLLFGLFLFSIVYICFGFADSILIFGLLFLVYGIYAAASEGIFKALISNISDKSDTATAIGFYNSFSSVFAFFASTIGGILWFKFGPQATFLLSGIGTLLVIVYLSVLFIREFHN